MKDFAWESEVSLMSVFRKNIKLMVIQLTELKMENSNTV